MELTLSLFRVLDPPWGVLIHPPTHPPECQALQADAGALSMLVLIITSGYAIVRTSIPGWWIWAYWISPFAYGLRAVVINELTSPDWARIQPGTTETVGDYALKQFAFFTER